MPLSGRVHSLQLCPGHRKPMRMVPLAEALRNGGLKGDIHALPDSPRQVLLVGRETLELLGLEPGQVKENITTEGISLESLAMGTRIHIGDAVVRLTRPCSPCARMDEVRPGLRSLLKGRRGVLARVEEAGIIRCGDKIRLHHPEPAV